MYISGSAQNLERRIKQLSVNSADYNLYYTEVQSYSSIATLQQKNRWIKEFIKKEFAQPTEGGESLLITESGDIFTTESGNYILL